MRICVFCGSSDGARSVYRQTAAETGRQLAARGIGVVYGGGRVGCMGSLAEAVLAAGGEIIGVIPQALAVREVARAGLTTLHVVGSMHERKAQMAALSDAFLALPGGFGTLEELFEAVTWRQLGYHDKPSAVLNVEGYFDALLRFCDDALAAQFVRTEDRDGIASGSDVGTLIDELTRRATRSP